MDLVRSGVYRVTHSIPELGAQPGDILFYGPGHLSLVRDFAEDDLLALLQEHADSLEPYSEGTPPIRSLRPLE